MNTELFLPVLGELLAKGTAVLMVAALVVRMWRAASAAQRHFIWFAAMVVLLLLPSTRLVNPLWKMPLGRSAKINTSKVEMSARALTNAPLVLDAAEPSPAPKRTVSAWQWPDPRLLLAAAWLAGTAACLTYRLLGCWRLSRVEKRSALLTDERVLAMARDIFLELEIGRAVRLRVSEECRVPMTWGTSRPVLLLPVGALHWNDARIATALRHEAGHIRRQDYLVRWIASVACAIYWPNPLVWLAARTLRIAQEQATDDLVLGAGTEPEEYATQLFDAARSVAAHGLFVRHAVAMASPSTLENRVLAIVDHRRDRRPVSRFAAALGILLMALTFALCTAAQLQGADAQPPPGNAGAPVAAPKEQPGAMAKPGPEERAAKIIIPSLEFRDTPLSECVAILQRESFHRATEGQGVNIEFRPAKGDQPSITVSLTQVPLLEAARYVASLGGLAVSVEADALIIGPPAEARKEVPPTAGSAEPKAGGVTDRPAPSMLRVTGSTLLLRPLRVEDKAGDHASKHVTLSIPIVARPDVKMDLTELVIKVMFYDSIEGGEPLPTVANVTSRWKAPPVDWAGGDIEELVVDYDLSKAEAARTGRKYFGYAVHIFYKKELQAAVAEPVSLLATAAGSGPAAPEQKTAAVPVDISADTTRMEGGVAIAEGHVTVKCGTSTITADSVRYRADRRRAECSGKVEIKQGANTIRAERVNVEFDDAGKLRVDGDKLDVKTPADPAAVPFGMAVPGKPGFVISPFAPKSGYVDVRGFEPGTEVKCPYTRQIFRVPEPAPREPAAVTAPQEGNLIRESPKKPVVGGRAGVEIRQNNPVLDRAPISRRPGEN